MIELDAAEVTAWSPDPAGGPDRVVRLLGPVSLRLTERHVAVVGANGSGKSTLARLLNGLVLPSAGQVRVDGLDTATDGPAVRRRVGFVFTDPDAQIVMPERPLSRNSTRVACVPTATMSSAPLSSARSIATSSLVPVAGNTTCGTPSCSTRAMPGARPSR